MVQGSARDGDEGGACLGGSTATQSPSAGGCVALGQICGPGVGQTEQRGAKGVGVGRARRQYTQSTSCVCSTAATFSWGTPPPHPKGREGG